MKKTGNKILITLALIVSLYVANNVYTLIRYPEIAQFKKDHLKEANLLKKQISNTGFVLYEILPPTEFVSQVRALYNIAYQESNPKVFEVVSEQQIFKRINELTKIETKYNFTIS